MSTTGSSSRWKGRLAALLAMLAYCGPAYVMMAGMQPDSPGARIDPNIPSSPFTGVGSVVVGGGSYSGVVVAPRFVLTASHLVTAEPSQIQFVLNVDGDRSSVIQAAAVFVYPTANFPNDDLALIELAVPVPPGVAIYPLMRASISIGRRITLVGYGASGNGDIGVNIGSSSTVKRSGQNVIDTVLASIDGGVHTSSFYLFDFDGPFGSGSRGGPTLGNALETMLASGDSGSAALVEEGGAYQLVGINTFLASSGTVVNGFGTSGGGMLLTRPEFLHWIDVTTNYTTPGSDYAGDAPMLPE